MKEYAYNDKNNFIAGWYIEPKVCDDIFKKGEQNKDLFASGVMPYTDKYLHEFDQKFFNEYMSQLWSVVELYKEKYPDCYRELNRWSLSYPRIQRYEPGMYYKDLHCENDGRYPYTHRHLAYMTYLNDIEVGGGTEYPAQNLITKAEKGLTLIWPANWTHCHKGIVAPTETKYIVTGWCNFDLPE